MERTLPGCRISTTVQTLSVLGRGSRTKYAETMSRKVWTLRFAMTSTSITTIHRGEPRRSLRKWTRGGVAMWGINNGTWSWIKTLTGSIGRWVKALRAGRVVFEETTLAQLGQLIRGHHR